MRDVTLIWPFFLLATTTAPSLAQRWATRSTSFCCLRVHRSWSRHQRRRLSSVPSWEPFHREYRSLQSNKNDGVSNDEMIAAIEKQVIASVKSRIDVERVMKALDDSSSSSSDYSPANLPMRNDLMYENEDLVALPTTTSKWHVAFAAAVVAAGASFGALQNYYLSTCLCCFVFVTATLDDDDSLSGALARILGRSTIRSVQASQPKIKALARALVTGEEEIVGLKAKVRRLQEENAALLQWKETRMKVDEALPRYSTTELKETARFHGQAVGGTKSEVLLRLVEANVILLE